MNTTLKYWEDKINEKINDVEENESFTRGEMLDEVISFIFEIKPPINFLKQLASTDISMLNYYKEAYKEMMEENSINLVDSKIKPINSLEDAEDVLFDLEEEDLKKWIDKNKYKVGMEFSYEELLFISAIKKNNYPKNI